MSNFHTHKEKVEQKLWKLIQDVALVLEACAERALLDKLSQCTILLCWAERKLAEIGNLQPPIFEKSALVLGFPKKQVAELKNLPKEALPLTEYAKRAFSVLLGLDGEAPPETRWKAAQIAWKEELELESGKNIEKFYSRLKQAMKTGLPRLKSVLDGKLMPLAADSEFYEKLSGCYPGITSEALDELLAPFHRRGNKTGQSRQRHTRIVSERVDEEGFPMPSTEWLQPLWALFLHPKGPTLDRFELCRRVNLTFEFIEPIIVGGLKNLQAILSGEMADPEPQFTRALIERWPGKTLVGILDSIKTDADTELTLTAFGKEVEKNGDSSSAETAPETRVGSSGAGVP